MEALKLLAKIYSAKGEPEKGLPYTERSVRMAPRSWIAHYLHGAQLMQSKQFESAATHLDKAKRLNPSDTSILFSLARAHYLAGNSEKAMPVAVDLLYRNPDKLHQQLALQISVAMQSSQPVGVCFPENDYTATGWVWDNNFPGKSLDVQIFKQDVLISIFKADHFTQGLLKEGIGTGNHGFRVRLPAQLSFNEVTFKIITPTDKGGKGYKAYSFFSLSTDVGTHTPVYMGEITACAPNLISGWAWNTQNPSQRLHVVLEDRLGNNIEILSNKFNSTLLSNGTGAGQYGFWHEWQFSEGAPLCAIIWARIRGCREYLPGSPCVIIDPDRYPHACHLYGVWLRHVDENPLFPPALPELLQQDFLFFLRQQTMKTLIQI